MNDVAGYLERLGEVWWLAAAITVMVVGLCGAAFYFRGWLAEAAASSRFFVASFVFHLLLLMLLAAWSLPTVVDVIVSKMYEADAAAQPFDNNQHQSHEDGQEAWEKLADLKALETSVDVVRRETEPLNIPNESQQLQPTISLEMARLLPSDRLLYVPPDEPVEPREPVEMSQRALARPTAAMEIEDAPDPVVPQVAESRDEAAIAAPESLTRLAVETRAPAAADAPQFNPPIRPLEPKTPSLDEQPVPAAPPASPVSVPRPNRVVQAIVEITEDPQQNIVPAPTPASLANIPEDDVLPRAVSATVELPPAPSPSVPAPRPPDPPREPARLDLKDAAPVIAVATPRARSGPPTVVEVDDTQPIAAPPPEPTSSQQFTPQNPSAELTRGTVPPPDVHLPEPGEIAGPSRPNRRLSVGDLGDRIIDLPPAFAPNVSLLERNRARASRVVFAEDSVGMQEMFTLRQGDIRKQYIELFGGTPESESAVNHGLEWLKAHQNADGSWSLHNFHENCKGKHANCPGAGGERSNSAATGLALLPFLAAGHTHQAGDYQPQVAAALKWLIAQQKDNGDLLGAGDLQRMYSHSIAAIALCEAYGMSHDAELEPVVRKALDFIVKAQHAGTGGWRYEPNQPGDTSVVGWAMMALKSGEMAGIATPQATLDNVQRWFEQVEGNKPKGGGIFGYQNASGSPAMTAEGLLCLQFLGADRNSPRLRSGADYMLQNLPQPNQARTSYYWYYGTQVMYHMQGPYWDAWNSQLRDHLVASQIKDGPLAGTWDLKDQWEQRGGRVYATALKLLMLEVYYRHLPLYHQLDE